jgi:hypothetical protein
MSSSFLFFISNLIIILNIIQCSKVNSNLKYSVKNSPSLRQLEDSDIFLIGFDSYYYNSINSTMGFNTYLSCDKPKDNITLPLIVDTGSKSEDIEVNCERTKRQGEINVFLYKCNTVFKDSISAVKFNNKDNYKVSSLAKGTMDNINKLDEPRFKNSGTMNILKNAEIVSQNSLNFEVRGTGLDLKDASKDITLVIVSNNLKKEIPCQGNMKTYEDDKEYYTLSCTSSEALNTNLNDSIGYYNNDNKKLLKIEFPEESNSTTVESPIYYQRKKSAGLSTGGIVAIIIPTIIILLGIAGLVFLLRNKNANPNPPLSNMENKNNTIGIAGTGSSQTVVQ